MNITHLDLGPVIYGIAVFLGLYITVWKLSHGKWLSTACDIAVFFIVFSMHGGHSTRGGLVAAIAALLAGLFFPALIKRAISRR